MQHEQGQDSTGAPHLHGLLDNAEDVIYWTEERMSRLFYWLMGPRHDDHWEALRATKAVEISCFETCASEVFNDERPFQSLQRCYHRSLDIFKQIYTTCQALDWVPADTATERVRELLAAARASGFRIWEGVTPELIELWHQRGWYKIFYYRWHNDPTVILENSLNTVASSGIESHNTCVGHLENKWKPFTQAPVSSYQNQPDQPAITTLISRLEKVFCDEPLYRRLLGCQQDNARKVLNLFQGLLDMPQLNASFRRNLIVATQRISTKSGLYPTCYDLKNIILEGEHAVAAGGFADVFKGVFEGQVVCLKAIRIYRNTEQDSFLKQFSKEAMLWGQLSHPNILPIYGLFRFQGRICFVSPWMEAGDITSYLKQRPEAPRTELAVDIARGLSYLHRNGIIHGDLKGPNILINDAGRACLADFGISSVTDSEILAWSSNSSAASKGGSARWQAPELFDVEADDMVKNTEASDVYACACVFYEVFLGMIPFANLTREPAVIAKIQSGARPSRPADSSPAWTEWGLTEGIWSLMENCWKTVPEERPSIGQIVERLTDSLTAKLDRDNRVSASGTVWSPSHFRKRMHEAHDVMSASDLDALLEPGTDNSSGTDHEDFTHEINGIDLGLDLNPESSFGTSGIDPPSPRSAIPPLMPDGWNSFIQSILPALSESGPPTATDEQSNRRSLPFEQNELVDASLGNLGSLQDLYDPYYDPPLMHYDFPTMHFDVPHVHGAPPSAPQQRIKPSSRLSNVSMKRPHQSGQYHELEKRYNCSWSHCNKAYSTLEHLNDHISARKHGTKRSLSDFKNLRLTKRQKV